MTYLVRIKASAAKALAAIPLADRLRIAEAIDRLKAEPHAGSALKGEFAGLRRLRLGNYRILYEVSSRELVVLVVRVAQRGRAYR